MFIFPYVYFSGSLSSFIRQHPNITGRRGEGHFFELNHKYEKGLEFYRTKMFPESRPGEVNKFSRFWGGFHS